jgi:hypothetical protein
VYSVRAQPVEALLDAEPFDKLRTNGGSVQIQFVTGR